jgi:hypothetical protein
MIIRRLPSRGRYVQLGLIQLTEDSKSEYTVGPDQAWKVNGVQLSVRPLDG